MLRNTPVPKNPVKEIAMEKEETFKIKPAGRHILTIGRELIQDPYAAVIELIKNAYDADSPDVIIEFKAFDNWEGYRITIADHGHGMSKDTVVSKWLVPSTDDKLERRLSPHHRIMQGRKGIGRYSASLLGKDLLLSTVQDGEETSVFVEWQEFEDARYLDDVEIQVAVKSTTRPSGTRLVIEGTREMLELWDQNQFDKLLYELKKLKSPVFINEENPDDRFDIHLKISKFPGVMDFDDEVKSYPLLDLFDYRISGKIGADGKGELLYAQQKSRNFLSQEEIAVNLGATGCGELWFDVRVYDREKEAIESLIQRGLKDESGRYLGNLQARQLLNSFNGIGVYRNGFRIRPLGDPDFDWLRLNERRVQNPSLRIGSNQAIGFVQIQSEEQSGLTEKSARDGLKENAAYNRLKNITQQVIGLLEARRFDYRRKSGQSRSNLKVERQLEQLFSFTRLKREIRAKLLQSGIPGEIADEVLHTVNQDEKEKNKLADEIRQAVAIYQGQATLGKIINVVLHEGRRPLNYFKNQVPNLHYWYDSYRKDPDPAKLEEIVPVVDGVGDNAEIFVQLFKRLDPLAAAKRGGKGAFLLKKLIRKTFGVFEQEMSRNRISLTVNGAEDFNFVCWQQDMYAIFTNLADNSIFWMLANDGPEHRIQVDIVSEGESLLYIDYRDSGPGIDQQYIESEVIFEPQFSTKPDGTGLGLAIAGEAALRNGLELKVFASDNGAYFRLQPKTTENE